MRCAEGDFGFGFGGLTRGWTRVEGACRETGQAEVEQQHPHHHKEGIQDGGVSSHFWGGWVGSINTLVPCCSLFLCLLVCLVIDELTSPGGGGWMDVGW